jgi:AraC-like DNA-binding protein
MGSTVQTSSDDVLKQRARELLANQAHRLHDVAAQLGYQDPSSFRLAFRRWYGTTPSGSRIVGWVVPSSPPRGDLFGRPPL